MPGALGAPARWRVPPRKGLARIGFAVKVIMLGPFGLHPKGTMRSRALPAARALAARGHRVHLVMPPWHTPEVETGSRLDLGGEVRIHLVPLRGLAIPLFGHLLVAGRMVRLTMRLRPDVVHAFKPKAYSGLAAGMLRVVRWLRSPRRASMPALLVDTDDWEGPGGWNELGPYPRWLRRAFEMQERRGLRSADAVTVASRALETIVWSLGVQPSKVTYLPNAIDDSFGARDHLSSSARTAAPPGARPPTILLYTRFFDFPLEYPLAVLEQVLRSGVQGRLVVAGTGLRGEEGAFGAAAKRRGLADHVELVGWLDASSQAEVLGRADVAIFPLADNLVNRARSPMKLLDLLSAGLPVVADDVGEVSRFIDDGRTGIIVAPGHVDECAAALAGLLTDERRRESIGTSARKAMGSEDAWSRRASQLEAAYGRALESRGG